MNVSELLTDLYGRLPDLVRSAVTGLTAKQLRWVPAPGANSIGWLVWHLTRIQDDHVSDILGSEQVWTSGDWARHFGVEADPADTGYGHSPAQVAAVQPDAPNVLIEYYDAVSTRTFGLLEQLTPAKLDRIVDRSWTPPVTMGVRLISVANDDTQHVGQAAYVRGLLKRS